jgi:hypothetical protein
MKTHKILICLLCLIAAIGVCIYAVFGWFIGGDSVHSFTFSIAVVDMQLDLYKIADFDNDGIPDVSGVAQEGASIDSVWSTDGEAIFDTKGALNDEAIETEMKKKAEVYAFYPTQCYTYRLDVYNTGDVDSYLVLSVNDLQQLNEYVNITAYYFAEGENGYDVVYLPVYEYSDDNDVQELTCAPLPIMQEGDDISLKLYLKFECVSSADNNVDATLHITIFA